MNSYEVKKQARIDRLRNAADKARAESKSRNNTARKMASVIPFGQPILVGHHSEKRDGNYRTRIEGNFRKAYEAGEQAQDLDRRADAAESNRSISSDDPEAVIKLQEKIDKAESLQATMKGANKCVRTKNRAGLVAIDGISEATADQLMTPDFAGRLGFAPYQLANNSANIRRMKKRIEVLRQQTGRTSKEEKHGDITLVENAEENRLQLFFPGKPSVEVRTDLKSRGFRWAPSNGCWQRQLNNGAIYAGQQIVKRHAVA